MITVFRTSWAAPCALALVIPSGCFETSGDFEDGTSDASSESSASTPGGNGSASTSGHDHDDAAVHSSDGGDTRSGASQSSDGSTSTSTSTNTSTSTSTSSTEGGGEGTSPFSASQGTDEGEGSDGTIAETGADVGSAEETGSETIFEPCPPSGPCKILPLGDSITLGASFEGGYRIELFRLALAEGREITFTGTRMNGPSMVDSTLFPRNHEGVSGETIEQIGNRVPDPALNDPPHIILLHAGSTDVFMNNDANVPARLAALLDELISQAPDALLVVSNLIPISVGEAAVDSFNATIEPMVEQRADAGAHIVFADQFTGFPTSELVDGTHPNEAGYARMAGVWYDAIEAFLR